jgi:hypothetical protein
MTNWMEERKDYAGYGLQLRRLADSLIGFGIGVQAVRYFPSPTLFRFGRLAAPIGVAILLWVAVYRAKTPRENPVELRPK